MRLETLMNVAHAAGYAMGDLEEHSFGSPSADQRRSTSDDPMIVSRAAHIKNSRSSRKRGFTRADVDCLAVGNLPLPVKRASRSQWADLFTTGWWGGSATA